MRIKGWKLVIAGIVLIAIISGTAFAMDWGKQPSGRDADIRGTVTQLARAPKNMPPSDTAADPSASVSSKDAVPYEEDPNGPIISVFVEGTSDKASVSLTKSTKVYRKQGDRYVSADAEQLSVGTVVEVTFDGPVAESYPVQAKAGTIVIVSSQ